MSGDAKVEDIRALAIQAQSGNARYNVIVRVYLSSPTGMAVELSSPHNKHIAHWGFSRILNHGYTDLVFCSRPFASKWVALLLVEGFPVMDGDPVFAITDGIPEAVEFFNRKKAEYSKHIRKERAQ